MFDRNKNSKNTAKTNKSASNTNNNIGAVNMVSEGTEIIGTLITQSDIRVAGTVDGEVKVDGKVMVASSGHVDGNVDASEADIAGRVEGEVHVNSKLTLRQSAVVECDVYTQNLIVEEGATFNGECHMHDYESENEAESKKNEETVSDSISEDGEEKVSA